MNDNCITGLSCPKCGQEASFWIAVHAWSLVHDDGTEETTDVEWDAESYTMCADTDCGWEGPLSELEGNTVAIEECGCCGHYHRLDFVSGRFIQYKGDCRNDEERFASEEEALERLGKSHPHEGILAPPKSAVELMDRERDEQGFPTGPWYPVQRWTKGTGDKS